jgi:hypothetical protein
VNPHDNVNYTHYAYPETTKDRHLQVRNQVTGFIMEDISWYSTVLLPWQQTDETIIQWNEWHFNTPLADRVPYEGVSRLITSSKRAHRAHVVRRGLAFVMEADYADSPEGIDQWEKNVLSIAQSVQETVDHDTIWALLTCKTYQKAWMQKFGTERIPWRKVLMDEIHTFGSANMPTGEARLQMLIENHKRLLRKNGITADMLILWPGAKVYLSMSPPERTEYWKSGPGGITRRDDGPMTMGSVQGLMVFETRDFDVTEDMPAIDLMQRPVQIAEFYEMLFTHVDEDCSRWSSNMMGTVIYDENADDWKKITLHEAFTQTQIFDQQGRYSRSVDRLVSMYNTERRAPRAMDGHDGGANGPADGDKPPTFFLVSPDGNGTWAPIQFFGQMDMQHMTKEHVKRIAESLAKNIHRGGDAMMSRWQNFMHLMHDLQSQGYNNDYWVALIAANTPTSVDANGNFVGEATPRGLAKSWGAVPQLQWTPNEYGSLNLPQGPEMAGVGVPAGYANGPGLRTLAAEASKPDSPWNAIGTRARDAVSLLESMLSTMRTIVPTSDALGDGRRSPWFHKADALTTFVDTAIGLPADPLFIAHLPTIRGGAASEQDDDDDDDDDEEGGGDMKWFALPGVSVRTKTSELEYVAHEGDIRALFEGGDAPRGVKRKDIGIDDALSQAQGIRLVVFEAPSGGQIIVPWTSVDTVVSHVPELRALGTLPAGNTTDAIDARRGYLTAMAALTDAGDRLKLAQFVHGMGSNSPVRTWNIMRGMNGLDESEFSATVNALYLSPDPTPDQFRKATDMSNRLIRLAGTEAPFTDVEPLTTTWKSAFATGPRHEGAFAYYAIANNVQRILDLSRAILSRVPVAAPQREAARQATADNVLDLDTMSRASRALEAAGYVPKEEVDELERHLRAVQAAFEAQNVTTPGGLVYARRTAVARGDRDAARRGAAGASSAAALVADDDISVARAAYYRSPLTSTRALLESLSSRFAGRVAKPLVLPSDPTSGHTMPYGWHGDDVAEAVLPAAIVGRPPSYTSMGAALSISRARPAYATLPELMTHDDAHTLDACATVHRFRMTSQARFPAAAFYSAGASAYDFDNGGGDDDDDDDDAAFLGAAAGGSDGEEDIASLAAGGAFLSTAATIAAAVPSAAKRSRDSGAQAARARMGTMLMGGPLGGGCGGEGGDGYGGAAARHPHHHPSTQAHMTRADAAHASTRTGPFVLRWRQANEISDPITRIAARVFLMARADRAATWTRMIEQDVIIPMGIILARPAIEHDMASAIMVKGGVETGANFFGGTNAAKGADTVSKRVYYNYTFRHKPVVYKPEAVVIIENLKFVAYRGGNNTDWITCRRDMDRTDSERPSLIALAVPIAEKSHGPHLDLSGQHNVAESDPGRSGPRTWDYSSAEYYNACVYNFNKTATPLTRIMRSTFPDRANERTTLACQGAQFLYNRSQGLYSNFKEPQGHLKKGMARPGGRDVMNGVDKSFGVYDYGAVRIE